jgi:hypothetical protein
MRFYKKIVLILFISFVSCKKNESVENDSNSKFETPISDTKNESDSSELLEKKFLYQFEYSKSNSNQTLGINILDNKTIEFHLFTETLPCDTEYSGIAENLNRNLDGEIDEDNEGGYFVNEYFKEEKEFTIGIRLAEDLSKVTIKYIQKNGLETDCLPITKTIMHRIK